MPQDLPELNSILHSGALSYGKWGKEFEKRLGEFIGNEKITVVNSYNSAMLITMSVIGLQPGDEVIASPMSCLASNQPLATQNLKVVWADIDPDTGTLDPESVKRCISERTKAIFHNHFCGYPGYIDEINTLGRKNGIIVVDDAIEAFGSQYKGRMLGSTGSDITVFSFQTVRLPNTIDGGAIAFRKKELFEKAQLIRDYGIDRKNFRDQNGEISIECDISLPGYGATISEINSYIGVQQMSDIANLLSVQKSNGLAWTAFLAENFSGKIKPIYRDEIKPNNWVFGILCENKIEILNYFRKKGYYASGVHLNNNHYTVFKNMKELPGVAKFHTLFLAIPSGWWFKNELALWKEVE
jgi:dTDP-4-amino-4,6-dideoxygalactose transaminase